MHQAAPARGVPAAQDGGRVLSAVRFGAFREATRVVRAFGQRGESDGDAAGAAGEYGGPGAGEGGQGVYHGEEGGGEEEEYWWCGGGGEEGVG